eukprot:TRINITY_DN3045_c0_g1_i2.p1 TRINITY_DN3045_c0_g1~~TRINITY_DN3045_c0_g1_i2.p1  ORF type:complete len:488 (+),score=108.71 TRINITY_DN3045_c0_g1_i2:67-1530(+)
MVILPISLQSAGLDPCPAAVAAPRAPGPQMTPTTRMRGGRPQPPAIAVSAATRRGSAGSSASPPGGFVAAAAGETRRSSGGSLGSLLGAFSSPLGSPAGTPLPSPRRTPAPLVSPGRRAAAAAHGEAGGPLWPLLTEVVFGCAFVVLSVFAFYDFFFFGLGTSNSRVVSWFDSLNSCHEHRRQQPWPSRRDSWSAERGGEPPLCPSGPPLSPPRRRRDSAYQMSLTKNTLPWNCRIAVVNFIAKFGSQTLASVMLDQTPVLLKGPRHLLSFASAFALLHACPGDVLYLRLCKSTAWKALMGWAVALYKLRKVVFVIEHLAELSLGGMAATLVAASVVVEGSSFIRRFDNWLSTRGTGVRQCVRGQWRLGPLLRELVEEGLVAGLFVARRLGPVLVSTAMLSAAYASDGAPFTVQWSRGPAWGHDAFGLLLRLAVLGSLLRRYRVPQLFGASSPWLRPAEWEDVSNSSAAAAVRSWWRSLSAGPQKED